jgi:transcriptional regulator with XRE-family HTH domain
MMVTPAMERRRASKGAGPTRLALFLVDNGLQPKEVADVAGISRQHLLRLRNGTCEPTRPVMIWVTAACRRLVRRRARVRITELFDLGDGER